MKSWAIIGIFLLAGTIFLSLPQPVEARSRSTIRSYRSRSFSPRIYKRGGSLKWQRGYIKRNGQYIAPHLKTYPDQYKWNNRKNLYGF